MAKGYIERIVDEAKTSFDESHTADKPAAGARSAERLASLRGSFLDLISGLQLESETPYKAGPTGSEDSEVVKRTYSAIPLSIFVSPDNTETCAVLALPYVNHGPATKYTYEPIAYNSGEEAYQMKPYEGEPADLEYGFDIVEVSNNKNTERHITAFRHHADSDYEETKERNRFAAFMEEIVELQQ